MAENVRIATRGSQLALAQTGAVRDALSVAWPDATFEIVTIETRGDREIDRPLPEIGGKGLFTEALEEALLQGDVDLAVHSLKDLPTEEVEGLRIGAVVRRADARDVWVSTSRGASTLAEAPAGATVGTSSERRRAQTLAARPDVRVAPVRGNVETRIEKLDDGQFDALIMAAAGLIRLGLDGRITAYLDPPDWLPAPGQGAIAVQARLDDDRVGTILTPLDHPRSRAETSAERTLLEDLQGGCQVPVGAQARLRDGTLALHGLVARPDGTRVIRAHATGSIDDPETLGRRVAAELRADGAEEILELFRETRVR